MRIEIPERSLSEEEIRAAMRLLYRAALRWAAITLGMLVLFTSWLLYTGVGPNDPISVFLYGVLALGMLVCFWGLWSFLYRLPRIYMKQMSEIGPLQIVLDDEGIRETAKTATVFHSWDAIKKFDENAQGILILFVGGGGLFIPRRLLGDDDLQALRQRLADYR